MYNVYVNILDTKTIELLGKNGINFNLNSLKNNIFFIKWNFLSPENVYCVLDIVLSF